MTFKYDHDDDNKTKTKILFYIRCILNRVHDSMPPCMRSQQPIHKLLTLSPYLQHMNSKLQPRLPQVPTKHFNFSKKRIVGAVAEKSQIKIINLIKKLIDY